MAAAYLLYARAAALAPRNAEYWQKAQALRLQADLEIADAAKPVDPPAALLPEVDSAATDSSPLPSSPLSAAALALPPIELAGTSVIKDLDLTGNARQLFEQVGAAYGLDATFDNGYDAGGAARFRLKGVDYREALHALEMATGSFVIPLTETGFLVAKDTPQKRTELEPVAAVHVEVPETISAQEFQQLVTAVQQSTAVERFAFTASNYSVEMRDRLSKVLPARDLFQYLAHPRAQVAFEVKFLQVSRNDAITYGFDVQSSIPVVALTTWLNNQVTVPANITGFVTFGGGKSLIGLGVMASSLIARMTESSGKVLLDALLRSLDNQAATMLVGERYPVLSAGYFGPQSANVKTYSPPPSYNLENLGLSLKVTPTVHSSEEVTLDMEAEYKVLSGVYVDTMPVIASRALKCKTRLKFGEWATVAGLLDEQEARTIAGLAGLSRVPVLAPLFSTRNRTKTDQEIFILVRPYLLTRPPGERPAKEFFIGSETRPLTRF